MTKFCFAIVGDFFLIFKNTRQDWRMCMKFCVKNEINVSGLVKMLQTAFGESGMHESGCFNKWHWNFKGICEWSEDCDSKIKVMVLCSLNFYHQVLQSVIGNRAAELCALEWGNHPRNKTLIYHANLECVMALKCGRLVRIIPQGSNQWIWTLGECLVGCPSFSVLETKTVEGNFMLIKQF